MILTSYNDNSITTGMPLAGELFFMYATILIAVPTGVKVFNWLFTLYGGRVRFSSPVLWLLGFMRSKVPWDPVRDFTPVTLATNAPNILVVLYDDTGLASWSPYGGRISMPTMDRLARGGLTYTLARSRDNAPSIGLVERLGFALEGRLRAEWETHIGVRDTLIYGLLRDEWRA